MNSPVNDRKATIAWCFYDWANSSFTTLVVTFIYATYFTQTFAADEKIGTSLWSKAVAISAVLIALLSPLLGALADRGGARRFYLILTTLVCVGASIGLTFIVPGDSHVWAALGLFILGNVAFEVGLVFYNSFLPVVASADRIGRISGFGWAAGYAGGLLCLVVALLGFVGLGDTPPWFSLSQEQGFHVRATNLLVAGWFLLFSLPMFFLVRDTAKTTSRFDLRGAFVDLKETFRNIQGFREVVKFLLARLIYNDGLVTIFAFGGIYAAGTFGMKADEVIVFGVALNLAAGIGAWIFGYFDDRLGGKRTVMASLVALVVSSLLAVVAPTKAWFWVAGLLVGIFSGPNQSASRSLMGRFVPERHRSEFFGFFAFSGKATAFLGPLAMGFFTEHYGQRVGVSTVLFFFIVGGVLLMAVDEKRGIAAAAE